MKRLIMTLAAFAIAGGAVFAQSLKVYSEENAPLQIKAPDGALSGIAIDAVREIQKRVGNTDPIQIIPWARSYQEVQTDPNVALFAMSRTADRNPLFQWVGPLDEVVFHLYVKSDSTIVIKSLEDAKKLHAIGVYKADVRDLYLTKAGFTNLDRVTENETNVKKLMLGRIDAFAATDGEAVDLAKATGFKPSDLKEAYPFLKTQQFIAFSKQTPAATVKAWQDALDAMKKDKTFEHIFRKYEPTKALPGPAKTTF
jgi:polar amino acid transport system substrate-binding protein